MRPTKQRHYLLVSIMLALYILIDKILDTRHFQRENYGKQSRSNSTGAASEIIMEEDSLTLVLGSDIDNDGNGTFPTKSNPINVRDAASFPRKTNNQSRQVDSLSLNETALIIGSQRIHDTDATGATPIVNKKSMQRSVSERNQSSTSGKNNPTVNGQRSKTKKDPIVNVGNSLSKLDINKGEHSADGLSIEKMAIKYSDASVMGSPVTRPNLPSDSPAESGNSKLPTIRSTHN